MRAGGLRRASLLTVGCLRRNGSLPASSIRRANGVRQKLFQRAGKRVDCEMEGRRRVLVGSCGKSVVVMSHGVVSYTSVEW